MQLLKNQDQTCREAVTKKSAMTFYFQAAHCRGVPSRPEKRHGRAEKSRENVATQKSPAKIKIKHVGKP